MGHFIKLAHYKERAKRWLVKYLPMKDHWGLVDENKRTISLHSPTAKKDIYTFICTFLHEVGHITLDHCAEGLIECLEENEARTIAYIFYYHHEELIEYLTEVRDHAEEKDRLREIFAGPPRGPNSK